MSLGFFPFFSGRNTGCTGMPFAQSPSLNVLASVETPSENTCSTFTSVSLVLKMARKRLCPGKRTPAKRKRNEPAASAKKTPPPTRPQSSKTAHHRDSAPKNKKIWLFTADAMKACIEEVKANQMNQATQYLWWRCNFFDGLLCLSSLFFRG